MALISLATYKTLTNTTDSTYDTLTTTLLEVATDLIENYCDRVFTLGQYIEWTETDNCCKSTPYYPKQFPVKNIIFDGTTEKALTITNSATANYLISINDNTLIIANDNLTEATYDLTNTSYDTLTELKAAIESAFTDLSIVINSEVSQVSKLLKPAIYNILKSEVVDIYGAEASGNETSLLNNSINSYGDVIVYNAGYATIPYDLQFVCANLVKDTLNVAAGNIDTNIKSQSITNYSITYSDTVDLKSLISGYISNYASTLNYYRKVNF